MPIASTAFAGCSAMYNRTTNENGTYNTRCLYCFMTIASAVEAEPDLQAAEDNHLCPEKIFAEMLANSVGGNKERPVQA
jgi:hypothetical protein